jgi:type II secretory pathway component PulJ
LKKLNAFTILELIVAMVISSLVIGAGFMGYEMVVKQDGAYRNISSGINDAVIFHSVLGNDITKAKNLKVSGNGLICNYEDKSVKYDFNKNVILRKLNSLTDTFKISNDSLVLFYKGAEQKAEGALVDQVKFRTTVLGWKQSVWLSKEYSADGSINELTTKAN